MFHGIHHLSTTIISHTASSESSETQDKPSHIGSEERVSLETVTNSLVSVDGEHLSLLSPKDTSNVRGCIMNFFMHIEAEMRCSIRHSILKSKERIPLEFSASLMAVTNAMRPSPAQSEKSPSVGAMRAEQNHRRSKWLLQQISSARSPNNQACLQTLLMAAFVVATGEITEAIKGGLESMRYLAKLYQLFQDDSTSVIMSFNQNATKFKSCSIDLSNLQRKGLSALMLQDMKTGNGIKDLLKRQVVGEKDFCWCIKPRSYITSTSEVVIDILQYSYEYKYEYLGGGEGCLTSVWHQGLEKATFALLHAFRVKRFSTIFGAQEGKLMAVKEVACKLLGRPLMIRAATNHMDRSTIENYLSGVQHSNDIWLCLLRFDCLPVKTQSYLAPVLQSLRETLCTKATKHVSKDVNNISGSFLCFTMSHIIEEEIPANVMETMRTISVIACDLIPSIKVIASLLNSKSGFRESITALASFLFDSLSFFGHIWRGKLRFGVLFVIRVLGRSDENFSTLFPKKCLRLSLIMHMESLLSDDLELSLAKKVINGIWNQNKILLQHDSISLDEESMILPYEIKQVYKAMGLQTKNELICKTRHFIHQLTAHNALIIFGPCMTGKSKIVGISECVMEAHNTVIYPKSVPLHYLFGRKTQHHAKWQDGILTDIIRKSQTLKTKKQQWITLRGPTDTLWTTALENLMTQTVLVSDGKQQFLDLLSGEHLLIQHPLKLVIETNSIEQCSPSTVAKCALVSLNTDHLNWRVLFDNWFQKKSTNQSYHDQSMQFLADVTTADSIENRWKKGQEPLIQALFEKLTPAILEYFETKCRLTIATNSTASFRNLLEIFVTSLNEAISNLKEKKYLRSWIQAAFVFSVAWSFGGILEQEERIRFDSWFRDILMGKSLKHSLPAALNNKFDSMPPTEGTVFDFIFDYKARGQWKHWNDSLKTTTDIGSASTSGAGDVATAVVPTTSLATATDIFIGTSDTARFSHLLTISESNNRPFLLLGGPACGKTSMIHQKLKDSQNTSSYEFVCLSTTTSQELNDWMLSTLTKKKHKSYGPEIGKGVIFIDDFSAPTPDETGVVHIQQMIIELIETSSWYSLSSNAKVSLEQVGFLVAATPEHNIYGGVGNGSINDIFSSHFHKLYFDQPSEETLNKFFSTALNVRFKERNFPPEVTSVIPTLVLSSIKIYQECKKVLSDENPSDEFIQFTPNLRDVFRTIEGCSTLPRESAENKKLFTRLWVHEVLRSFYDRLTTSAQRAIIFESVKNCVKSIFRENFDSAFEHLGKVDGQVTELNLRGLIFGSFPHGSLMTENKEKTGNVNDSEDAKAIINKKENALASPCTGKGSIGNTGCVVEIQDIESFEMLVQKAMEDEEKQHGTDGKILQMRHTLELISHINHALTTPSTSNGEHGGSHLIIGGQGGEGRSMASRIAAKISNFVFFHVPSSPYYGMENWRRDLKKLVKKAGSQDKDTVIYVSAAQLLRFNFVLHDVNSLMARGYVLDLFTVEERHELNESVHSHLLSESLSPSCNNYDLSPTALYEIFVNMCKRRLHLIISYNRRDSEAEFMFRMNNKMKEANIVTLEEWGEDDLRTAAELLIEEVHLDRDVKRNFIAISILLYKEASLLTKYTISSPNPVQISSMTYLRYVQNFKRVYEGTTTKLNDMKGQLHNAIDSYKMIGQELEQLKIDLEDLMPKLNEHENILKLKCEEKDNLARELENIALQRKIHEKMVASLLEEERVFQHEYDNIMTPLLQELNERRSGIRDLKPSDLGMTKMLKNGTPSIRVCISAICILLDVPHDKGDVASDKKNRGARIKFHEGADYWTNGKRLLMDPTFQDRLLNLDLDRELMDQPWEEGKEIMSPKLRVLTKDILSHPDWDPFQAGKIFMPAEVLCSWLLAVARYYQKRIDMMHLLNRIQNVNSAKNKEMKKLEVSRSITKETHLNDLKMQVISLEEERRKKVVHQNDIIARCELGEKLKVLLRADFESMMKRLDKITDMMAECFGDAISLAFTTSITCSFPHLNRLQLESYVNNVLKDMTHWSGRTKEFRQLWLEEGIEIDMEDEVSADILAALKMSENSYWPLLWDPDGTGLSWLIKTCQRGKQKLICIQQDYQNIHKGNSWFRNLAPFVQILDAVENGEILIIYEAKYFDSHLDALFSRRIKRDGEKVTISIAGVEVPYNENFQLYVVASEPNAKIDIELLNKCLLLDFSNDETTLKQLFKNTIIRNENPKGYIESECIEVKRQLDIRKAKKAKSDIMEILTKSDISIMDDNAMTTLLFEKKGYFEILECEIDKLSEIIQYWRTESLQYSSTSVHCYTLFIVTRKFDFSLQWFLRILKTALENSNKSNVLEKRLRYIRDTITFSIVNQVTKSLEMCDRLQFMFVLALELLITECHLPYKPASIMKELCQIYKGKKNINECPHSEGLKITCKSCVQLPEVNWSFFSKMEKEVPELRGISKDLCTSSAKWRVVIEAKEPDNLPLHEPWYSKLSKFNRFVVIAALRPDKILELVRSFISDVVGIKIVDIPTNYDLSRVLTDAHNSQIIMFQTDMSDATKIIKQLALDKKTDILTYSMGGEQSNIILKSEELRKTGKKWLVLENFHEAMNKSSLLKMHSIVNQSFHPNYRLFIVTKDCPDFPSLPMKNGVKIVLEPPRLFRDILLKNFDSDIVHKMSRIWEQKNMTHSSRGRYMRLVYGLCMFHSMANFRARYGPRGGWNCIKGFDFNDLECAIEYLEVINRYCSSILYLRFI